MKSSIWIICGVLFYSTLSHALVTEVGLNYGYQKKTFNPTNYYQSDTKSASLSLYFLERFALELSYTDSFYESQESDTYSTRVTQQSSQIAGADLIYVLTDKTSMFQPYIKGGTAFIKKKKQIRYANADTIDIQTKDGFAPSYGAGIKFKLSERFSFKVSYDMWQTPLDDGSSSDDNSLKVGLSMYL
jgi:opacity protein-like surface antigen